MGDEMAAFRLRFTVSDLLLSPWSLLVLDPEMRC